MRIVVAAMVVALWVADRPLGDPWSAPLQVPAPSILVSLSGGDTVALIAADSGETVATFPVRPGPHELVVSRDSRLAFVANVGTGPGGVPGRTVSVLDLSARTTRHTFDLGSCERPHDVRASSDSAILWVACAPSRAVLELDASSGSVRRTWSTPADGGWFVEATPDGRKLYVPHLEGKSLTAIDRDNGRVTTVASGGAMSGIGVTPDGREVWVVAHEQRRLHIIATDSNAIVGGLDLPVADFGRIRFTADGRRVLLVQGSRLTIIDVSKRQPVATRDLPSAGKVIAVSPDASRAAITHPSENRVTVIDLTQSRAPLTFAVGPAPDGIAWLR
jgi:DNA-binding beta-propeller fold protein YncE